MGRNSWIREVRDYVDSVGGGTVKPTQRGHYEVRLAVGGGAIYVPGTPSDHRAIANFKAHVRRVIRGLAR